MFDLAASQTRLRDLALWTEIADVSARIRCPECRHKSLVVHLHTGECECYHCAWIGPVEDVIDALATKEMTRRPSPPRVSVSR